MKRQYFERMLFNQVHNEHYWQSPSPFPISIRKANVVS